MKKQGVSLLLSITVVPTLLALQFKSLLLLSFIMRVTGVYSSIKAGTCLSLSGQFRIGCCLSLLRDTTDFKQYLNTRVDADMGRLLSNGTTDFPKGAIKVT